MRVTHNLYRPGARPGARELVASKNVDYVLGDLVNVGLLTVDGEAGPVAGEVFTDTDRIVDDETGEVTYEHSISDEFEFLDNYGQPMEFADDDEDVDESGSAEADGSDASGLDRAAIDARAAELGVEIGDRWGDKRAGETLAEAEALIAGRSREELIEEAETLELDFDPEATPSIALAEEIAEALDENPSE